MDNTKKFSGLADTYSKGRPTYASDFIESLYCQYGLSKQSIIADIGSGTGKFSKQLLDKGSFVYGVEPNDDMRNTASKELSDYKNFYLVNGTASKTKLDDKSVDYITVAQAFHWFDTELFKRECKRILKDDGKIFLIWNMRDMTSKINQQCFEIYLKYCPNFKGFGGGIQKDDIRIKQFFDNQYEYKEFDNSLVYDKDTFMSRSVSGSYSLKEGDKNYKTYVEEISKLFDRYAKDGVITMANKTVVYIGRI